jgi:hypothetical protein
MAYLLAGRNGGDSSYECLDFVPHEPNRTIWKDDMRQSLAARKPARLAKRPIQAAIDVFGIEQ